MRCAHGHQATRKAFARGQPQRAMLTYSLEVIYRAEGPGGPAGYVDLSLVVILALIGIVGVHLGSGGVLIANAHVRSVMHAGTVLALLWLCLLGSSVSYGWSARKMYAGPISEDEPLLLVCLSRLRLAGGWTLGVVAVLLILSLIGGGGTVSISRFITESTTWLLEYGWWVALVSFAWSAGYQLDHIWGDLNRLQEEEIERNARNGKLDTGVSGVCR